ncbi:unnamed protein product [Effrenium voratum]|uniref:Uncharacterized protein n=1 Tax=Effrenium voratum TaxID=2562239 RepID=A0AA36HWV9_9DINO|nr:unnamed protein product [Effrenium voratum]CAJ1413390.1 unnamed protein product [Effrenium voratum]
MAGWDRYGEEKKYRKDVAMNDNPKHVGEPLRKLTLEDRLELRRQTREREKKRAVLAAEIDEEGEGDEPVLAKCAKVSDSKEADLDIVVPPTKSKAKEVVDLAEEDGKRAAAIRRRRRAMKAKKATPEAHPEVEVLE